MVHRGQVIEDGTLRVEFLTTSSDTGGALHEMRATYAPDSPFPPAHYHPDQEERFIVEQGELLFDVNGDERTVTSGEQIVVPRGAVHRVRNPGPETAVARWETRPALRTAEFLERVAEAREHGGLLRLIAVVSEHGDVYRLAARPRWLYAGAVRLLGPLARRRNRPRDGEAVE